MTTVQKLGVVRKDRVGTSLVWLSGAALGSQILLVAGLLWLLVANGLGYFWQRPVLELTLHDGTRVWGEVHDEEPVHATDDRTRIVGTREKVRIGNRDLFGLDFQWVEASKVKARATPADLAILERLEYGIFVGRVLETKKDGKVVASGAEAWIEVGRALPEAAARRGRIQAIEKGPLGRLNGEIARARLAYRSVELAGPDANVLAEAKRVLDATLARADERHRELGQEIEQLRRQLDATCVVVASADGRTKEIPIGQIVAACQPNTLGTWDKLVLYTERLWGFLWDEPRESNTEGGIFPALFGTVLMVFLMTFVVTPLGVLAALYLREYSRQGLLVRLVRIAVNNLAGVPSIVFGMFGLGFFVYGIGGSIDRLFYPEALPTPTFGTGGLLWAALTLALLTVPVVIVATEEGLAAVPRNTREGSLALGATKFETTWRVVLPAAAPGILTGVILAIARAAGEVAPLMIVGMVKLAALPVDAEFPFLHLDRKFMHLGFHIYDVGFQSPNVEATKPLVYATALLLVAIVTVMNLGAIRLRNHLRRKYATSAV